MAEPLLELETMIGFGGQVSSGLVLHPDKQHIVYPVGCTVAIENLSSKQQEFLSGHTNNVSCLTVSRSGKYIGSGQVTYMGFKADIIVWLYDCRGLYCKLTLHRNKVEALAFSPNDRYLVSLGGQDDGSVVVWNLATKEAICGSPAQPPSAGLTHTVMCGNTTDDMFVTAGSDTLRVWQLNATDRKIRPTDVKMGQTKRSIRCIQISEDDSCCYCGTSSGDILAVHMSTYNLQAVGPEKAKFAQGVISLALQPSGELIVGAGDGTVCLVHGKEAKFKRTSNVKTIQGGVTSVGYNPSCRKFFVGTTECNIYQFSLADFSAKLMKSCHYDGVTDVVFPSKTGELIVTSSMQDVRIWNLKTGSELLRITVPNMKCNAIAIMGDGTAIITGWNDGRIRAYYPESGKLMYTMDNAYGGSVTAVATTNDCRQVISGSNLGHVVVWETPAPYNGMKGPMHISKHFLLKEHKAEVTSIRVRRNDQECVTSSIDGSCIIWDLKAKCRRQMIRVNTLFKNVCYHPEEYQILTTGSDRKVGYWETFDASMIRELDGSMSGSVNAIDISSDGQYFVTGGDDKLVKVWLYDQGEVTHVGIGHSAPVTGVRLSPDMSCLVSVSADGSILKWKFPHGRSVNLVRTIDNTSNGQNEVVTTSFEITTNGNAA